MIASGPVRSDSLFASRARPSIESDFGGHKKNGMRQRGLAVVTSQRIGLVALIVAAIALSGCVPVRNVDERFAAGWRPSRAYCAFGAETAKLAAWCAEVNFGAGGLLAVARSINHEVLARAPGRLQCTDHVADVRRRLATYPDYAVQEVYSCDDEPVMEDGRPVCHVSVLVTSLSGARVVIDNGRVLDRATGGVAEYDRFTALVDRHWVGPTPASLATPAR